VSSDTSLQDVATPVLQVEDLRTYFYTEEGEIRAVDGVHFSLYPGRTLAIVGESGCGKSVTSYSLLRLIRKPGHIVGGRVLLRHPGNAEGAGALDLLSLPDEATELHTIRGGRISMIFQDALAALSPVHTIGNQLTECLLTHSSLKRREAEAKALALLERVGLTHPELRLRQYPHELSGGMRQRVMIAMALIADPEVVIADEPTTALDVTIQRQVLELIKSLQKERNTAVLLITHDLGVVAHSADDVLVMYLGKVVEQGSVFELLKSPKHPYTLGLLQSLPSRARGQERLPSIAGSVPALSQIPKGCPFHPRCPHHQPGLCDVGGSPPLVPVRTRQAAPAPRSAQSPPHQAACLRLDVIHQDKGP